MAYLDRNKEKMLCPKHGVEILPTTVGWFCPDCAKVHTKPTGKEIAKVERAFEKLHKMLEGYVLERDLSNLRIAYGESMVKYKKGFFHVVDRQQSLSQVTK